MNKVLEQQIAISEVEFRDRIEPFTISELRAVYQVDPDLLPFVYRRRDEHLGHLFLFRSEIFRKARPGWSHYLAEEDIPL